jgi:competence ComEA-like helix-hairpin-helix protein
VAKGEGGVLNFTRQERAAVVFLVGVALVGNGVSFLVKRFAPVKAVVCLDDDFGKINVNTADVRLLQKLPGVGAKTAQRIVDYRGQQGAFTDIDDLQNIKGLRGGKFEKIKESVTIH